MEEGECAWISLCVGEPAVVRMTVFVLHESLWGKLVAGRGSGWYVNGGRSVWAAAGWAREGGSYRVRPRYRYPIERVFSDLNHSPSKQWRNTGVTAENLAIAFNPNNPGAENDALLSDMIAIVGINTNFQTFSVDRYDAGVGWVSLATVDLGKHTYAGLSRQGRFLTGGSPADAQSSLWWSHGELAGWIAKIVDGGTTIYRRIRTNSAGQINSSNAGQSCVIELEGIDGSEGSSSLSVTLIPHTWVLLVRLNGASLAGLRVAWGAEDTVDGERRAGALWVCHAHPFGWPRSWGAVESIEANVDRTVGADGTTRGVKRGPPRRSGRSGWVDAHDMTGFDSEHDAVDGADLDWLGFPSGVPMATYDDVPYLWEGHLRELDGPLRPLVLLHRVPSFTGSLLLTRRREFIVAELTSQVQRDHIVGDSLVDDLFRGAPLVFEEKV